MTVERLDLALLERPMVARRPVRKDADQNTPDFCIRCMSIPDASERCASHGPNVRSGTSDLPISSPYRVWPRRGGVYHLPTLLGGVHPRGSRADIVFQQLQTQTQEAGLLATST